jgi:outer membrane protein TolC
VYEARSLNNTELKQFLVRNLQHGPAAWDFEALAWVAFFYNPTLDVARAQWDSAQAATRSVAVRQNPTIALTPGYNTSASGGVSPWFPAVNFDFLLENGRKRDLRTDSARLAAESARQAVFSAAWRVRSELRQALLDLTLAEQRAISLRTQAEQQQRIVALLESRLRAGAIARPEISTARLALVRAEAAAADSERQAPVARQRIAQALGVPVAALAGIPLAAPLPSAALAPDQLTAARRASLQNRADILGALARYDAAQSALALEVAKQRPDLHLGPGYQWDQGENKWSVALTFELPLFHHNEAAIAEAEAKRHEAAAQFIATQAQALHEIDAALAAHQSAVAQLVQLRRAQTEIDRQLAATETRRRAGTADRLEVETAGLERTSAELALREAEVQVALAAGQLEDALQVPFPNLAVIASSPRPFSTAP